MCVRERERGKLIERERGSQGELAPFESRSHQVASGSDEATRRQCPQGQLHFIFRNQFLVSVWKFRQRFDCRISNPIKFNYVSLYLPPPPMAPLPPTLPTHRRCPAPTPPPPPPKHHLDPAILLLGHLCPSPAHSAARAIACVATTCHGPVEPWGWPKTSPKESAASL